MTREEAAIVTAYTGVLSLVVDAVPGPGVSS